MTSLTVETITRLGSRIAENPFPHFRDRNPNRAIKFIGDVPARYRELAGWNTGDRVLPYSVQDRYDRRKQPQELRVAVLENDTLRATFLLEMGGRLLSLVHKPNDRELLSCNPVFQPANLAIRNAWFSGGIEWNAGQYGHTVFTCSPVFAAQIAYADGSPGLRIYEFERMKQLFWQTDFYLPNDSDVLVAHTRIANPFDTPASMYWWTNIAVPESEDVRVIAPATHSLYHDPRSHGFGLNDVPNLPSLNGGDGTYSTNSPFANEFFLQCDAADMPFITALDKAGTGLFEASTPRLNVRKLFCWGMGQGGRHWQDYLAQPGVQYIEIQCGLAPTQVHGSVMPANTEWDFTEVFGLLEADAAQAHADWAVAVRAADSAIKSKVSLATLAAIESECRTRANVPSSEILQDGAGWGALELRRRVVSGERAVPEAFVFPEHTLDSEPRKWLALLDGGDFADQDATQTPGAWMMQREWRDLLAASVKRAPNAHALLHHGVMLFEQGDDLSAEHEWRQSMALTPSAWAARNLAKLCWLRNEFSAALSHYAQAWEQAYALDAADKGTLAGEATQLMVELGHNQSVLDFYDTLAPHVQADERVQIALAKAALVLNRFDLVENVLRREFATIREGEVNLTNLWFEMWAKRDGVSLKDAKRLHPAPKEIDFGMGD